MVFFSIGLKFWKAPNRKIVAVQEDELVQDVAGPSTGSGQKQRRVEPDLYIDDASVPLIENFETLVSDTDRIKSHLRQVFAVTKKIAN